MQTLSVQTNSMEPALHPGDAVVVKKVAARALRAGDVIAYRDPLHPAIFITHRIVTINARKNTVVTKGDNESVADTPFDTSLIIGRVSYGLVKAGYLLDFLRSPAGLILGTYMPAAIVLWLELRRLKIFYTPTVYRLDRGESAPQV